MPLRLYKQLQMMVEQQAEDDSSSTPPSATTPTTLTTDSLMQQQQEQQEPLPDQQPGDLLTLEEASMAWSATPLSSATAPADQEESAASSTAQPDPLPADIMARRAPRIRQGRGPGYLVKTTTRTRQAPYTIKPEQMSTALAQEMEAFSKFCTSRWVVG